MMRLSVFVLGAWLFLGATSAQAQVFNFFRKSAPPEPPAQKLGRLVAVAKSDPDERKRTLAVEELREIDTKAFPEIVPILVDVAQSDSKAGVRSEAINSLVRIRPISTIAGQAIERAAAQDENWRNRMAAQAALVRYRLAGYSVQGVPADPKTATTAPAPAKNQTPNLPMQSQEPPLGDQPPIIYLDQNGKQIAPPKGLPAMIMTPKGPVAVQPAPKAFPAIAPPAYVTPPTVVTTPPTFTPPPPIVTTPGVPYIPTVSAPPMPVTPTPPNTSTEPTFRNVSQPGNTLKPPVLVPSGPTLSQPVPVSPILTPPTFTPPALPKSQGPSLDLPLPPTGPPALTPAPNSVPSGPALNLTLPNLPPSGRVEPSPRLAPTSPPTTEPAPF